MSRIIVLTLLAAVMVGCSSYRPAPPLPAPASGVRVSFLSPRDMVARTPAGDTVVLSAVKELSGSIVRAQLDTRMDSVWVRLGSARTESGGIDGIPEGALVAVPRAAFVRIDQKSLDPIKTFKVVAYTAGILLLIGLLALGSALDDSY